jgi:subtilisin
MPQKQTGTRSSGSVNTPPAVTSPATTARNVVRPGTPSPFLTHEFNTRGVADVIVLLSQHVRHAPPPKLAKPVDLGGSLRLAATLGSTNPGSVVQTLSAHFISSERSYRNGLYRALSSAPKAPRLAAGLSLSAQKASLAEPAPARYFPRLGVMLGTVNTEGYQALRAHEHVEQVLFVPRLQLIRPTDFSTAKLTRKLTWGIKALKADKLWKQGLTGKGVKVGHLDTGVDGKHPALKKALEDFAYFDEMGTMQTPSPAPFDTDKHGTHTAATIAGRPVKGLHVGVAPGALLNSACVIEGGDVIARVLGGMDWAIGKGVRILNMSLGIQGWHSDFLALTKILRESNILPVFAVGNEGPNTSRSPGNYVEALSVGAADESGHVAWFSSSERVAVEDGWQVPDLVGPGTGIISAAAGGGYLQLDGTSMATPHISGLAALLMQAKPDKTIDEVESAIFQSCKLGQLTPDRANRGMPDAVEALKLLGG